MLISRRGRTACALATTLAAGSLTFAACSVDRPDGQASDAEPPRVGTVMGTGTSGASTSAPQSATMSHTASRQTSLTARAFMEYLDAEQQHQILNEGLLLNDLTRAQQVTMLQVFESLLNENSYSTTNALLGHIISSPEAEPHYLHFSRIPAADERWKLTVDGPMIGLHAQLAASGVMTLESGHIAMTGHDAESITQTTDLRAPDAPVTSLHDSAVDFYHSLSEEQLRALTTPGGGGLSGADLSDSQRDLITEVTADWLCLGDEGTSPDKRDRIADSIDETTFLLSENPANPDQDGLSLLIDGPEVFLDINGHPADEGASAVHSVFRDPSLAAAPAG